MTAANPDMGSRVRKVASVYEMPSWWVVRVTPKGRRRTVARVRAPSHDSAMAACRRIRCGAADTLIVEPIT